MENNTEITYIYLLIDPRDNEVRYVGKTSNPKSRLSGHITECKKETVKHRRSRWIKSLLRDKLKPIITFVKVCPLSEFEKYEAEYIKLYSSNKLTNSDENGQGNKNRKKDILNGVSKKMSRKVYQYDLNGNFIKEYRSVRLAASELGLNHSNISRCCNGIYRHTGGYIFKYEITNNIKLENPNAVKKLVIEVDSNGLEINRWLSIMSCSRDINFDHGNLSRVCNGKSQSIKGRFFKFL